VTGLDYAAIGLYALAMLAIGRYHVRRVRTADDYLLGGRSMSPLLIGLSLFATLTSTLTYLALPGEMI
jgi:SSS family solute:Na+ symporter